MKRHDVLIALTSDHFDLDHWAKKQQMVLRRVRKGTHRDVHQVHILTILRFFPEDLRVDDGYIDTQRSNPRSMGKAVHIPSGLYFLLCGQRDPGLLD